MADQITKIADVIVPELFEKYVIKRTMELSAFFNSGIVTHEALYDALASQPAPMVQMPFFNDLDGDSETALEDTSLNAAKITSGKDVAVIIRRAKMWAATDFAAAMSGADPMKAIGDLVAGFWARDLQKELISILKGVFGSTTTGSGDSAVTATEMSANILDISSGSGNAAKWTASSFIDAQQLLGDAQDQLTAIAMHSAVKAALKKQNLIATEHPSMGVDFETYQGKRVIVDDGLPVDSNGIYTTFLFGSGVFGYGVGNPEGWVGVELDRDKRMGSGVDYLINRKQFILHPHGIAYQKAAQVNPETPTRAELETAKNWKKVYTTKQLPIVEFKHKI